MKLAIHNSRIGFDSRWIAYCEKMKIPYKLVNCYENNIIEQLKGCSALLWHYHHLNPKDLIFAKQLLYSLEQTGFLVFPNFNTSWHFDDKVGQKYVLEAIGAPLVPSFIFYSKDDALKWVDQSNFPKVFKLRRGAGSVNVKLVSSRKQAIELIDKSFGSGFKQYDPWVSLKERYLKFKLGQTDFKDILKGILRFYKEPEYSRVLGIERGYAYFQDFIPNNNSDTRVIVIGERAFAVKRMVRKNDFRASGSGTKRYEKHEIDERTVKIAFNIKRKLEIDCISFDFIFDGNNLPLIVEMSYGFATEFYDPCPGYWDEKLKWTEVNFIPQDWIVDEMVNKVLLKESRI